MRGIVFLRISERSLGNLSTPHPQCVSTAGEDKGGGRKGRYDREKRTVLYLPSPQSPPASGRGVVKRLPQARGALCEGSHKRGSCEKNPASWKRVESRLAQVREVEDDLSKKVGIGLLVSFPISYDGSLLLHFSAESEMICVILSFVLYLRNERYD